MEKKLDRRIIKTRKAIRKAFAELLKVKDYNQITVKDIADTADISRKTFYYYYQGVWQIKEDIENEIIQLFAKRADEETVNEYIKNPTKLFEDLNAVLDDYSDFFSAIMSNENNVYLIRKLAYVFGGKLKEGLREKKAIDENRLDLAVKYTIMGVFIVYQDWFTSDPKKPIKEVCENLGDVMFNGLNSLIK